MSGILIVLFGTTILYICAASRIEAFVKTLALQGLLLFLLIMIDVHELNWLNIAFLSLETLIMKAIVIPYFLLRVIRRHEIGREVAPDVSQLFPLQIASIIFISGFLTAYWAAGTGMVVQPLYFGMSISVIVTSLLLIVRRKRIITHILCYMTLENGIFLLSLSVANEMPLLINLGVLLDLFVAIYLLVIFFNMIQAMFDGNNIDVLTELKD